MEGTTRVAFGPGSLRGPIAMQHDAQILQAARCLVDLYGADAAKVAEKRAMLSGRLRYGSSAPTWRRIARAIRELQGPGGGALP
jgi:hypothetical protein